MVATKTEEIRGLKETSNTLLKWALGILGGLATAGIIGNVVMFGQVSKNTGAIENIDKRLNRMEVKQDAMRDDILTELRK